jgi:hypothetical protein
MAAYIRFDRRGPARVENSIDNGLLIERGIQVSNFTITNKTGTGSDPQVLLRCLSMLGSGVGDYVNRFPQLHDPYPPKNVLGGDVDFSFCTVRGQRITGIDRSNRTVEAIISYHSPIGPQSPGVITYTVHRKTLQHWVRTFVTAGGLEVLSTWYQPGGDINAHWNAPTSPRDTTDPVAIAQTGILSAPAQKLLTSRVIEITGITYKDEWDSQKATFDAAAGCINSDTSGVWAPRGTWLYVGTDVTISNGGTIGTITHVIIEGVGSGRWFPILPYFDQHGVHPADSAPEINLQTAADSPGYPPPLGTQIRINGLTMASVQNETNFHTLFPDVTP